MTFLIFISNEIRIFSMSVGIRCNFKLLSLSSESVSIFFLKKSVRLTTFVDHSFFIYTYMCDELITFNYVDLFLFVIIYLVLIYFF